MPRVVATLIIIAALQISEDAFSGPDIDPAADASLRNLLERECLHLDRDKVYALLTEEPSLDLDRGIAPDLFRIIEGVIKRTDFDGIPEERTVKIIGLVFQAFRRGAPLETLDDIFDVAYVNEISVDQLFAAAQALKEFHRSDVPQDIFEEFVYHSIENGWDPAVTPVLTRGLIYGVDRGLSPDKVAMIIMLDVKNGELTRKSPDQLVLDAIQLVRSREPGRWRPLSRGERDAAAKRERANELTVRKEQIEQEIRQKERSFHQAERELKELREYPDAPSAGARPERDLEEYIRKLRNEIDQAQRRQQTVAEDLEKAKREVERQEAVRDRERQERRERDLAQKHEEVGKKGQQGRLDRRGLVATVDRYLGTPYRFGGDSERGMDCSAFTRRVYRGQGIELPRNSRDQAQVSAAVGYAVVATGDLVFFDTSINGGISHVGVFLGGGVFAHASSSKGVTKSSLKEKYYVKRFVKGGRIFLE